MRTIFILVIFNFLSLQAQEQFSVYFNSNKFELTTPEKKSLDVWINQNKTSKVVGVHGFCDEDGSTQYNDTLASKRIDHVFQIIKKEVKIREDFKTRSFGKLHEHSPIKAKNRKVTLFFLKEKDIPRENEILGIQTQSVAGKVTYIYFPEKLVIENPNGTKSEFKLDVDFMNQINSAKVGEKLNIKNLNFILNTFAVANESRGKLYELLQVMQANPTLKICIQGHLCCMTADKKDLSTLRAKAVYKFLEFNKIDKSRMTYKGLGVSNPLFPIPEKNEEERAANRRVEIEILEN